jgi:hypothetical protein
MFAVTSKNRIQRIALCLILIFTVLAITFVNATTENNYNNDTNLLPNIFESTHTENGYKANLVVNPHVTGAYAAENGYKLDLTINPSQIGGSLTENNYELDIVPENTFADPSDVAVTETLCPKTVVGQGYSMQINMTLANQALNYETFYVTISANTTTLKTQTVTLVGSTFKTLTLTWNTTGFAYGNYSMGAYAWPVPDETNTANNNCTGGWVVVAGVGDLTGGTPNPYDFVPDGKVQIVDISVVAKFFGQKVPPAPANVDLTGPTLTVPDGKIQIDDVATVAKQFGKHYPYQ